jgi:methylmalonyl-CoA/ethylmalonyl-CoA epimerase
MGLCRIFWGLGVALGGTGCLSRPRGTCDAVPAWGRRGARLSAPVFAMLKIKRIDHVAICVADMDEAAARWAEVFQLAPGSREIVESQKTETLLLPVGDTSIELIAPRGNEALERFVAKRGPASLHHLAIEVEGLEGTLALLGSLGVPLIDSVPRIGARGHKVAFVHPKATGGVLVELVEPAPHAPKGSGP